MTCEEAIEILQEVKALDDSMYAYDDGYMAALDMAIAALESSTPRLLKAEELEPGMVVWIDDRSWESVRVDEIVEIRKHRTVCAAFYDRTKERHEVYFRGTTWTNFIELYGVEWVAWTHKPNLEQRKSVKWRRSEEAAWCGVGYKGLTTAIEYL